MRQVHKITLPHIRQLITITREIPAGDWELCTPGQPVRGGLTRAEVIAAIEALIDAADDAQR